MNSNPQVVRISDDTQVGPGCPLLLIAGPCQIESAQHCIDIAAQVKTLCEKYKLNYVFKSSFDKANRTSVSGARGVGAAAGLKALQQVKSELGVLTLTDIHLPEQAAPTAEVVDILQIPAFLCRQTDLLVAAGQTGKAINCKKGQFLHPSDMEFVAEKIRSTGNNSIMLCERGSTHGYRDLIVDPRSFSIMRSLGYPVVFDATHSVQSIGGQHGSSGGSREFIAPLTRAAVATGIDALFIETHENPEQAPSDGKSMLPISELEALIQQVVQIRQAVSS